ncbi:hypothetical protein LMG18101_00208 [Ralstonia flaminis]|jgi:peptidoglycan/LPS O-acetylase OafA/YrhL|uniref:Acyltransferase n=2 Tax=Ralstonia flaminis TaxID=3058597 RepID=A0ABN9JF25_9RALS|nr:hypothetical protein LMG18101_00208 [Ralstonia sp. LMG 18101]
MVGATLVFCLIFQFPEESYDTLKNGLFIAIFYSNIFLARKTGYFDSTADQLPLLHTWSLSVEEQFYLAFPLLLLLLRRRTKPLILLAMMGALFLGSLAYSQYAVLHALPRTYFELQTRGFEFLIGALLAHFPVQVATAQHRLRYDATLLLGLAIISACAVMYTPATPMPGLYALAPCIGAALVIAGGDRAHVLGPVLSNPVTAYLGKLSYVLYLWHWPIFFALRKFHLTSNAWTCVGLLLCAAIAIPTHHLVEQPIRNAKWSTRKSLLLLFLAPAAILGALVLASKWTNHFTALYPATLRQSFDQTGRSIFDGDRAQRCWNKVEVTSAADCSVGNPQTATRAIFWGDSHAYQLISFMDALGKDYGLSIHDVAHAMCPPISDGPARAGNPAYQNHREGCLLHNRLVMEHILARADIDVVIMSAAWTNYINLDTGNHPQPTLHGFMPGDHYVEDTVARLRAAGKHVVLVDDVPVAPPELENCASNRLYGIRPQNENCTYPATQARTAHLPTETLFGRLKNAFPDIPIIHTYDVPCDAEYCHTEISGVDLYKHNDGGHLGLGGSNTYYRAYRAKHPDELASMFCSAENTCSSPQINKR